MGIIPEIKLNGKNYNDWVHKIEPFLTMRKQYDLVSGKEALLLNKRLLKNGIKEIRKLVHILKFVCLMMYLQKLKI